MCCNCRQITCNGFHSFHELFKLLFAKEYVAVATIENAGSNSFFKFQNFEHTLFNGSLRNKINYANIFLLTQTINAANTLLQNCWIPRNIKIDHVSSRLQIQPHTTCICRKKYAAIGIIIKVCKQRFALFAWHATMQILKANLFFDE